MDTQDAAIMAEINGEIEVVPPRQRLQDQTVKVMVGFTDRFEELLASMPGFDQLISSVQCMLVGQSIDLGEIWHTVDADSTIELVEARVLDHARMVEAWGFQR